MDLDDAVRRTLAALRFFWSSDQSGGVAATGYRGFYFHFLDVQTGGPPYQTGLGGVHPRQDLHYPDARGVNRAIADGEEEGFVKIHAREGSDRILGATIVARQASEVINNVSMTMAAGTACGRFRP